MGADGLATAARHRFADWPNRDVPNWRAGVYGVWKGDAFLYVGMAGRGLVADAHLAHEAQVAKRARGLRDRLHSHASGRRSGDQFCVYVCDRLVVPSLAREQLRAIGDGTLLLDAMTKEFIRGQLTYAYVLADDGLAALRLEREIQRHGLGGHLPLLNPSRG